MRVALCVLLLSVAAALAPLANAQSNPETAFLGRIIDHACIDVVADSTGCEQITLIASETEADTADLIILPDRRSRDAGDPILVVRDIVFNGAMWGMSPSISETAEGFSLLSEQSGVGRFPWFQTLSVTHDGQDFVVTNFAYSAYDRLGPRTFGCEVDYANGRFVFDHFAASEDEDVPDITRRGEGTRRTERILLANWEAFGGLPAPCAEESGALYSGD